MGDDTHRVTRLLVRWGEGDDAALDELVPLIYDELRRMARRRMAGERHGHSLQATALVNEAYLRLVDARQVKWQSRGHFLGIAARLMRQILVDAARTRASRKRGAGVVRVTLDDRLAVAPDPGLDVLALDEALQTLARHDERKAKVVELRFFGGLSVAETASSLNVSVDTVMRDWKFAKAWLARELRSRPPAEGA